MLRVLVEVVDGWNAVFFRFDGSSDLVRLSLGPFPNQNVSAGGR